MARSIEPLVVGRVIGDVLDMFAPAVEFTVQYWSKQMANGCEIKPSSAAHKPLVQIIGSRPSSYLYTLVMVDPDAPSPSEPLLREWLHWIVVDVPKGFDATKGREMVAYTGPQPPASIHRYIFALFKQKGAPVGRIQPPDDRSNLALADSLLKTDLGYRWPLHILIRRKPVVKRR